MNSNVISVVIGGDFAPCGEVEHAVRSGKMTAAETVGSLRPVFESADLNVVNLECPLTERGSAIPKLGPAIRAHPELVCLLNVLGVHVATLANNHIRDFGDEGVMDTVSCLTSVGIETVGAGKNSDMARNILYRDVCGQCVAIINVTECEFSIATHEHTGANPLDVISLLQDIQTARLRAAHVLVIIHGGIEHTHYPSPESVRLLRFIAEQGVRAVVRHHSHTVQGWETWKGVPIFYSLGNLFYHSKIISRPSWVEGLVIKLNMTCLGECTVELHPVSQCAHALKVFPLDGAAKDEFLARLDSYSSALSSPATLSQEWKTLLQQRKANYLGQLIWPGKNFLAYRLRKATGLNQWILSSKKLRFLRNMLTCDAHREILQELLQQDIEERGS